MSLKSLLFGPKNNPYYQRSTYSIDEKYHKYINMSNEEWYATRFSRLTYKLVRIVAYFSLFCIVIGFINWHIEHVVANVKAHSKIYPYTLVRNVPNHNSTRPYIFGYSKTNIVQENGCIEYTGGVICGGFSIRRRGRYED